MLKLSCYSCCLHATAAVSFRGYSCNLEVTAVTYKLHQLLAVTAVTYFCPTEVVAIMGTKNKLRFIAAGPRHGYHARFHGNHLVAHRHGDQKMSH